MDTSSNAYGELIEACQTMLEQEPEAIAQGISALVEKEEIINPNFADCRGLLTNKLM